MPLRHRYTIAALFIASLLLPVLVVVTGWTQLGLDEMIGPRLDAGFITTRPDIVKGMLTLADLNPNDVVYDLGCGDGRIVIAAAKHYGVKGIGIDLNPKRIAEANTNARTAGVESRVQFRMDDFFKTDFSDASVVMLYLPAVINYQLRPRLWKQLKIGSRVVSHDADMGPEWPPEKTREIDNRMIYYWTIREEHKASVIAPGGLQ
ncbi:MAG: class I SAM-dependent methyltransferase [Burkholderiaceae bacterium]|jgi:SAM-dependent methyltransferase|nr:class I SAM-dependent methyltransferase [Burkholderiaceae bacterium]